ncbi:MAG: HDIG domain-containing protein, partial [Clostridia bacterium]|nr:HDIG domain-containing protein [Clostridia bacterium]
TRLVELSNPNQPLLRRLLLEAPGTYHHSIIVANLAEAAAGEIGANGLLARVGAYYHDIGKIMRPMYFTENQLGDNPHDRTDPRVSTAIITAHPKDGVQLLKEKRIPEEIRNIVLTHHGNSPVIYFYNKSLTENGEANVDDFRYPGPRPSTREEAIVMLADTVEAAARSIPNADKEKIRELIEKLVSQKIDDGQLDDCDISLRDISRIVSAFVTVLSGAFHDRIEYPKVDIPKKHPEGETP